MSVAASETPSNRKYEITRRWHQDEQHPPPKWTIQEQNAPSQRRVSEYLIYRTAAIDGISYVGHQCVLCGAWSKENASESRQARAEERIDYDYRRSFRSARAADEYARRLQYGVPQNWEFLTALMGVAGGVAAAGFFELVESLV